MTTIVGIGEDYLDDDRSKLKKETKKMVKDNLTESQKKKIMEMGEKSALGVLQ